VCVCVCLCDCACVCVWLGVCAEWLECVEGGVVGRVCVCVCGCGWDRMGGALRPSLSPRTRTPRVYSLSVHELCVMYVSARVCVCMCVLWTRLVILCHRGGAALASFFLLCMYVYTCTYACLCVYECVFGANFVVA